MSREATGGVPPRAVGARLSRRLERLLGGFNLAPRFGEHLYFHGLNRSQRAAGSAPGGPHEPGCERFESGVRIERVAGQLFVSPSTLRYRLGRLEERACARSWRCGVWWALERASMRA
jgi:hypothetical protein